MQTRVYRVVEGSTPPSIRETREGFEQLQEFDPEIACGAWVDVQINQDMLQLLKRMVLFVPLEFMSQVQLIGNAEMRTLGWRYDKPRAASPSAKVDDAPADSKPEAPSAQVDDAPASTESEAPSAESNDASGG